MTENKHVTWNNKPKLTRKIKLRKRKEIKMRSKI